MCSLFLIVLPLPLFLQHPPSNTAPDHNARDDANARNANSKPNEQVSHVPPEFCDIQPRTARDGPPDLIFELRPNLSVQILDLRKTNLHRISGSVWLHAEFRHSVRVVPEQERAIAVRDILQQNNFRLYAADSSTIML